MAKHRTFKRRTHKRRRHTRGRTHKRRRTSVVRRKRFPTKAPHAMFKQPSQVWPERVLMKMSTQYRIRYVPSVVTGVASATGCTQMMFLSMNNIFSPGVNNGAVAGEYKILNAMVPAEGFNMMSAGLGTSSYVDWQVRGARCHVKLHWSNLTTGTPSGCPWEWVLFPVKTSSYNVVNGLMNANGSCTFPFDRCKLQQGRSRPCTLTNISANAGQSKPEGSVTCFSSPSKVEAVPVYYGYATGTGVSTTPPADLPMFCLAGSHTETLEGAAAGQAIDLEITITYSVLWWGRGLAQLSVEPHSSAVLAAPDIIDDTEEAFDRLSVHTPAPVSVPVPVREEVKEGKEEKKLVEVPVTAKGWFS